MTLLEKAVMNMPPPDVSPSTLNRQFSEDCPIVLGKESGSPCRMSHLVFGRVMKLVDIGVLGIRRFRA